MAKHVWVSMRANEEKWQITEILARWALSPLAWSIIGFLLARSAIFGEIWPFGFAFLAAWRGKKQSGVVLSLLGVTLGLASAVGIKLALPYCAAFALLSFMPTIGGKVRANWLICISLLLKAVLHYLLRPIPMVFIVAMTECAFATFSYGLLSIVVERCREKQLAYREVYAFLVAITLIISCEWSWGGISPRLFLCCALLVLGARVGGLGVSCILGLSLALLILLLGEPTSMVLMIVIACLLTGFLHKFGWGYYVGPGLALVFAHPGPVDVEALQWLVIVLGATWVARLVPQERLILLARIVPGTEAFNEQDKGHDEHLKKILDQKIESYLTVFEELEKTLEDNENPLFHKQMHGMAELLKTMKTSFSPQAHFTKEIEERLLRHFNRADLSYITALQCLDGFEIYGARRTPCGTNNFCQEVADFCSGQVASQRYGVTNTSCSTGKKCGFHLSPCPNYKVEIGKAKVASQGVSGDSQTTFEISPSKVTIVLSDGMGVGLKAHTESNVTLRLLERMVKAGYDLTTAVSLINHLLILRNQDDMFVTIDLVVVDLFTGQLEFVKIGAAPSYIKRGREVEIIHNHTLPVGVLSEVDVQSDRRTLKEGELLIMTTDGVLDAQRNMTRKDEWMCWNLRRLEQSQDMASLAEEILYDSIEVADGRVDDDMMVVVARIVPVDWGIEAYRRVQSSVQ